jgi:hypothetical protein
MLGEECDGADDGACPGECLPPGDIFECTCGDKKRIRLFASHELTDADAGWTGRSHQQGVSDLSGYITELSNCDCDAFSGPTCTGSSGDSECNVTGNQMPRCSWEPLGNTRCDARGNNNNSEQDLDCAICDQYAANAGDWCINEAGCDAQCYDSNEMVTGPCEKQADCGPGEICRGLCDKSQTCLKIPNGAPLPVGAAGAQVCSVQTFRDDIVGTRDLITGEHEFDYRVRAQVSLGEASDRPCPVCGGFCVGGDRNLGICSGRCSVTTATECRFDVDCPSGETCSSASPDCPGAGAFCQLELVCGSFEPLVHNNPCVPEYEHPLFGTMSNDCAPIPGASINGEGFNVKWEPATTGVLSLPSALPCSFPGLQLLECPCPADGGAPTKPNECAPACDAPGPNFGVGCATGDSSGEATTCAAGVNVGKICDEDTDCPGSTCSANPLHCTGDPNFELFACDTNADCGVGTCGDACPGGRCTLLCVPDPGDSEEGICAAGPPVAHCAGEKFSYVTCLTSAATQGTCSATCSVAATPCDSIEDCPSGETCEGPCSSHEDCEAGGDGQLGTLDDKVGAGACVLDTRSCYLEPLTGEGGSTVNGLGDPLNDNTVGIWCYEGTTNPGVNATSGFGGPGRVRQKGINVTNGFTAIP